MTKTVRWDESEDPSEAHGMHSSGESTALADGHESQRSDAKRVSEHQRGLSTITVAEFVEREFVPRHVTLKRTAGRRHYQAILKHILDPDRIDRIFSANAQQPRARIRPNPDWPYVDDLLLHSLEPDHIRRLMSAASAMGYSTQTVKHIRNAMSAIISLATREGCFSGPNPALAVSPPAMQREAAHVLSFDQTVKVIAAMRYPEQQMTLIAILTGMTIGEICGLQWKDVNLLSHQVTREEVVIPPYSIAVRRQWYRGELSSVPPSRKKTYPVASFLVAVLGTLLQSRNAGWSDFVFPSRSGKPINPVNIAARRLKAIGTNFGVSWLSWQVFRRTRAGLIYESGQDLPNQLAAALGWDSAVVPPAAAVLRRQTVTKP